MDRYLNTLY